MNATAASTPLGAVADDDGAAPPARFSQRWRSSATRLIVIYGVFFVAWSVVLIGAINYRTAAFLQQVTDEILGSRAQFLASVPAEELPNMLEMVRAIDFRGIMHYGRFDAAGQWVGGDIVRPPAGVMPDGQIRESAVGVALAGDPPEGRTRFISLRLQDGDTLVLARDLRKVDQVSAITRNALFWALSLAAIPGLIGGFLLSRGPLRRVRRIEAAMQPIARGDLGVRLPVSDRRDELDMLAAIVNRMLGEIERLIGEVKGVCDNIAHDLRTPLTRLRAQLHRLKQGGGADAGTTLERCITDVDSLLERFRALLRISELEDLRRRAGFGTVDLGETLRQVHELYAPVAEDNGIAFHFEPPPPTTVHADPQLLFEAFSNLVANAIKFTPEGGKVCVRATACSRGPRVDIVDSGPGIPSGEREAVLQRFYRSECGRELTEQGHGLGLSIVSAIVRLHGYRLQIGENEGGGARVTVRCWDDPLPTQPPP